MGKKCYLDQNMECTNQCISYIVQNIEKVQKVIITKNKQNIEPIMHLFDDFLDLSIEQNAKTHDHFIESETGRWRKTVGTYDRSVFIADAGYADRYSGYIDAKYPVVVYTKTKRVEQIYCNSLKEIINI